MKKILSFKRKSLVLGTVVAIGLLTGCGKEPVEENSLDVDAPLSINTAILYSEQHSSYDEKAEARRQEILKTKDTIQPTTRTPISVPVAETPDSRNFSALMAEAPSMVGMAMKKLNSAPAPRPTPSRIAPRMVEPEREVPGIRLRHWNAPMSSAVR